MKNIDMLGHGKLAKLFPITVCTWRFETCSSACSCQGFSLFANKDLYVLRLTAGAAFMGMMTTTRFCRNFYGGVAAVFLRVLNTPGR
jgi:hypothetical protein